MSDTEEFSDSQSDLQDSILNDIKTAKEILNHTNHEKMNDGEGTNPPRGSGSEINLAKLQSTLPAFYALNVRLWLKQVDAHFDLHNLRSDKTKFNLLHVQLRPEVLTQVADVIENPPEENKYETLKNRLISAFSDSEQKRLKTLISGIELGDRKPSALYNEMKQISGRMLPEEVLKNVWMEKLPQNVRGHVVTSTSPIGTLIEMADLIVDVTNPPATVDAAYHRQDNNCQDNNSFNSDLRKLQETVIRLSNSVSKLLQRPRGRSNSRSRSSQRNPSTSAASSQEMCWFHEKFGKNAKKCREPCRFSTMHQKN